MLDTIRSGSSSWNPHFQEQPRGGRGNLDWFAEALGKRPDGKSTIVLVGGKSTTDLRLRTAQSEAREDLLPSDWSHTFALVDDATDKNARLVEVPLDETSTLGFPPKNNALVEGMLGQYADETLHPNLAVLFLPIGLDEFVKSIERFKGLRSQMDAVELKARWLPYIWAVGAGTNPLHEGFGLPSAALVEAIAAANDFELTPGLASRSSCPEAIWQAARWWHEFHQQVGDAPDRSIAGFFTNDHHLS